MGALNVAVVSLFILFSEAALAEPDYEKPRMEDVLRAIDDYLAFKAEFFGGEDKFESAMKDFVNTGIMPHGISEQKMKEILATEIIFCAKSACEYLGRYVAKAVSLEIDFFSPSLVLIPPADAGTWGDYCSVTNSLYEQGALPNESPIEDYSVLNAAYKKVFFSLCEDKLPEAREQ